MNVIRSIKDPKKNKVYIDVVIKPNLQSLTGIDYSVSINPMFPYESKTGSFDPATSTISFEFTYK